MRMLPNEKLERAIQLLHFDRFDFALSLEQARKLYDEAIPESISKDLIQTMVRFATGKTLTTRESFASSNWFQSFPIKAMKRLQFSLPTNKADADAMLAFFGVANPKEIEDRFETTAVAYRQASAQSVDRFAVAAWIREAELVAKMIPHKEFDERLLRRSIEKIRQLTRQRVDQSLTEVQEICAGAGVAFVMVPELPATRISGCARWLEDGRAMIGLTVRYKTDDQLWFTFFHELGHVLLHRDHLSFVIDNSDQVTDDDVDPKMSWLEAEANQFARDSLIPDEKFDEFVAEGAFTNESVETFSESVGIGPGIVVGRLQREKHIEYHVGNAFKQKLAMHIEPASD